MHECMEWSCVMRHGAYGDLLVTAHHSKTRCVILACSFSTSLLWPSSN